MGPFIPTLFASSIPHGNLTTCCGECQWLIVNRGFAIGWDYAISWLTVLPFELVTAGLTIQFWRDDIHPGVWVTVFLVLLIAIQFFGVRGYGEGTCGSTSLST